MSVLEDRSTPFLLRPAERRVAVHAAQAPPIDGHAELRSRLATSHPPRCETQQWIFSPDAAVRRGAGDTLRSLATPTQPDGSHDRPAQLGNIAGPSPDTPIGLGQGARVT
jgi:hypothetical protein